MTRDDILTVMADAAGNPAAGPVAEWLPALADAVDAALNPTQPKPSKAKAYDTAELDSAQ